MGTTAILPFRTERVTVRAMRPDDVATFVAYRNDPEVARYQDWTLPYTGELAHQLIDGMDDLGGPVDGQWVQLAIDVGGTLAGDLGVHLDAEARTATLGFTLDPAHQGLGYATEAAGGLIDRLFEQLDVHRVAATVDPGNLASARLLERLGFSYEGRGLKSAYVRGEWVDDDRYAILAEGRRSWRERATEPPATVRLVEITRDNLDAVRRLATHRSQQRFVATVEQSFTDAFVPEAVDGHPVTPWLRAIEADGVPVGFLMLALRTAEHPEAFLWRFLVDARHQGRGIGRRALRLVAEELEADGDTALTTSWVPGRGSPAGFYEGLGFVPTGRMLDDEVEASVAIERLLLR